MAKTVIDYPVRRFEADAYEPRVKGSVTVWRPDEFTFIVRLSEDFEANGVGVYGTVQFERREYANLNRTEVRRDDNFRVSYTSTYLRRSSGVFDGDLPDGARKKAIRVAQAAMESLVGDEAFALESRAVEMMRAVGAAAAAV